MLMNTTQIIITIAALIVLIPVLRFALQSRVRRASPKIRYQLVRVLLVVGAGSEILVFGLALDKGENLAAILSLATALLIGLAGHTEMQKLRGEH